MIRIALRQCRAALLATAALTAVVVTVLLVKGLQARSLSMSMVVTCADGPNGPACRALQDQLSNQYQDVEPYLFYLTITTVLVATFWGAPLVSREIETGTAELAWSQSLTRRRWLAYRLAVNLAAVTALGSGLGLTVTWWLASFTATPPGLEVLSSIRFQGPLLPAVWVCGQLIGVLVGTVLRRAVPAMAATAVITFILAIAFNLAGSMFPVTATGPAAVLADQLLQAVPVLVVAAAALLATFRRLDRLSP